MAHEQIPITPDVVRWARERSGYSLADALAVFPKIEAWEAGESFPTYPQIEELAERFKIPVAVFFFPEPPNVPPISETFRTLPGAEFDRIPRRVRMLLRRAKALQINLAELCEGRNPAPRLITQELAAQPDTPVATMAGQVRDYLGVSLETQVGWHDDDVALKEWRQALLGVGIFVFKDAFQVEEYSGFCLYDDVFPVIYVNNSTAKTRQAFTLFHELAHLLFQTSGVDTLADDFIPALPAVARRIEVKANRFASEFLLPSVVFEQAVAGQPHTRETATSIGARFHVSRELVYRRFRDRDWISQAEYEAATAEWRSQKQAGSGGNPYRTKIAYLGRDYISLVFQRFRQNRIDEDQLADYLEMKPRYVPVLEDYFSRGGA